MILCKLMDGGILPTKIYSEDGGYDLFLPKDITIHEQLKEPLAIRVLLPLGFTGRVVPRSSAYEAGVEVNGTIDRYTGELFLTVKNSKNTSLGYKRGSAVAQLIGVWTGAGLTEEMLKSNPWDILLACNKLELVDELPNTKRGSKGHGSSGNVT